MEEFMKLNGNTITMIKFVKLADLNANIATAFLNTQTLKMILWKTNVYVIIKIIKKEMIKILKEMIILTHSNFSIIMISISLLYCC